MAITLSSVSRRPMTCTATGAPWYASASSRSWFSRAGAHSLEGDLTFCLDGSVQLGYGMKRVVPDIDLLVGEGDRYHDTCEIKEIHSARITIVLELIVPYGCSRRDGSDDGVKFPSCSFLKFTDLRQVIALVFPSLRLEGPQFGHSQ